MVRRGGGRKTQKHKLLLIDSWAHQESRGVLLITPPPPIPPIMDTKVFRPEGGSQFSAGRGVAIFENFLWLILVELVALINLIYTNMGSPRPTSGRKLGLTKCDPPRPKLRPPRRPSSGVLTHLPPLATNDVIYRWNQLDELYQIPPNTTTN